MTVLIKIRISLENMSFCRPKVLRLLYSLSTFFIQISRESKESEKKKDYEFINFDVRVANERKLQKCLCRVIPRLVLNQLVKLKYFCFPMESHAILILVFR